MSTFCLESFARIGKINAAEKALEDAKEHACTANTAWEEYQTKVNAAAANITALEKGPAPDEAVAPSMPPMPMSEEASADQDTVQESILDNQNADTASWAHEDLACTTSIPTKDSAKEHLSSLAGQKISEPRVPESSNCSTNKDAVAVVVAPDDLLRHKQEADIVLHEATRVHELTTKAAQMTLWQRICMLLGTLDAWLLLWNGFLQGFGLGMYQSFLFIALGQMGGTTTLMGLTITVDCIAEFPAFWFKEWFFKYISVDTMLHMSVLGYALRLALYALLPYFGTPWAVLPIQLLHVRQILLVCGVRVDTCCCSGLDICMGLGCRDHHVQASCAAWSASNYARLVSGCVHGRRGWRGQFGGWRAVVDSGHAVDVGYWKHDRGLWVGVPRHRGLDIIFVRATFP